MSNKVEVYQNGRVSFHCPGCNGTHSINTIPPRPVWDFNGNLEAPTFEPSVLVTYPANPDASEKFAEWRTERKCHSYVREGKIQFLDDSYHHLKGQTVDLPDWD